MDRKQAERLTAEALKVVAGDDASNDAIVTLHGKQTKIGITTDEGKMSVLIDYDPLLLAHMVGAFPGLVDPKLGPVDTSSLLKWLRTRVASLKKTVKKGW